MIDRYSREEMSSKWTYQAKYQAWLDVEKAKSLALSSSRSNSWHPYIVFYDRDLRILDTISKELKSYNERVTIPRDTKYVKISDIYTLENLKRGLSIYISK